MALRHQFRRFRNGSIHRFAATLLVPAAIGGMLMADSRPAMAQASTYFYLQATIQDTVSHAFGVLDANDTSGMLTGYVQVNQPSGSPSQLWEELNDGGNVRLKNKATGLCIGDATGNSATITLGPCDNEESLWQEVPHGPKRAIFRRTTKMWSPFPDIKVCIGKERDNPGRVYTLTCTGDLYSDEMVWEATLEPLGTASSGVTPPPPPPPAPPTKPTACQVVGAANCGLVDFTCNPFSAADSIVVSSGTFGVKVTGVQPGLGLVTASYLNQGNASVTVCAAKSGMATCGDPINVSFGPIVCTGPVPGHACPTGQVICRGGCSLPTNPECHPH